jgi:lipocalin-like protein
MKEHRLLGSAITVLLVVSFCSAQDGKGKKQTQQQSANLQTAKQKSAIAEKFIGTWRLVSIEDHRPSVMYHERNPIGYIVYDSTGHMSVQIVRRNDRARFASDDPAKATLQERADAFNTYTAYFGTYVVSESEGTVTHRVEGSLAPNRTARDEVRYFEFSGERVILIPTQMIEGKLAPKTSLWRLIWERVK